MSKEHDNLVDICDLALRIGVSASWIQKEVRAKRLPCIKAGRTLLFSEQAVRDTLLERAGRKAHQGGAHD